MPKRSTHAVIIGGLRATVTKQKEEIEYMKVSMFWEMQGPMAMQMLMAKTNATITKCRCFSCFMTERANFTGKITKGDCQFVPFFEKCLEALGIVVLQQPKQPFKRPETEDPVLQMRTRCVEAECHLVEITEKNGRKVLRWADFRYGALFWRAKREDDPEIVKMIQMVAVLSGMVGPVAELDGASDEDGASDDASDATEVASDDAKKGSDVETDVETDEEDEDAQADNEAIKLSSSAAVQQA